MEERLPANPDLTAVAKIFAIQPALARHYGGTTDGTQTLAMQSVLGEVKWGSDGEP